LGVVVLKNADRLEWKLDGVAAGFYQRARNLTYVLVYNASHMVPVDQPRAGIAIMHRLMRIRGGPTSIIVHVC